MPHQELTDLDLAVLTFERRLFRFQGAKDQAIKDELGLSRTRYEQLLRDLIDRPEAYLHDPVLVKRLRRLRDTRRAARRSA